MQMEINFDSEQPEENFWADAEIIDAYSREQALEDGILVDLNLFAITREHYKLPMAATASVWAAIERTANGPTSDIDGILHDIFNMSKMLFKEIDATTRTFTVRIGRKNYDLKMVCGPGDTDAPVLTLMQSNED